jgi:hypothetical protein
LLRAQAELLLGQAIGGPGRLVDLGLLGADDPLEEMTDADEPYLRFAQRLNDLN